MLLFQWKKQLSFYQRVGRGGLVVILPKSVVILFHDMIYSIQHLFLVLNYVQVRIWNMKLVSRNLADNELVQRLLATFRGH